MKRLIVALVLSVLLFAAPAAATSATRPSAPRDVRASIEQSHVVVTFQPPTSDGAARVQHYRVVAHPTNRVFTCATTRCTISGLTSDTTYFFTVAAVNRFGESAFSKPTNKVTPKSVTVTVTFDANGGTGTMADQIGKAGSTAELVANTFTNSGQLFGGWNTSADGSGTSYTDGAPYRFEKDATLYAQWMPSTYTVSFDANGGTGTMASQTSATDVLANLDDNTFTLSGFTFVGWNTSANGTGSPYADGAPFPFDATVTLYAQWIVTLNAQQAPGSLAYNWAGYAVTGASGGYQSVSGQWAVPTINCTATPNGHVSVWVGVNGDVGPGLFQTGTDSGCLGGQELTIIWWTDDAEGDIAQPLGLAAPGDVIKAEVSQGANSTWSYSTTDLTVNDSFTSSEDYSGAGASAEWIVESPFNPNDSSLIPLAQFTPITISNMSFTTPSGGFVTPAAADSIQMDSKSGVDEAQPSPVLTLGSSPEFTVYDELASQSPAFNRSLATARVTAAPWRVSEAKG